MQREEELAAQEENDDDSDSDYGDEVECGEEESEDDGTKE